MTEATFESTAGVKIFYRTWRVNSAPRGVVVIVPGFNAHSGSYQWAAEQLVAQGISAYALDLRGRGKSSGERFYVDSFDEYVADVASFVRLVKAAEPGLPVHLLGHSAGGVVSCLYAAQHQAELAGLVCESFAFKVPAPDFALSILKGLSHVVPHAHVLKLKNSDFSRDPRAVAAMDADPLIQGESQPSKTVTAMVRADELLEQSFPQFTLPLLILHGSADKATQPSGSQQFFDKAGSVDKTLKIYDGHFHDLLADVDKQLVMNDILTWLTTRLPKVSAA